MIEYQGVRILLTGDAESQLDQKLIEKDDLQRVTTNANNPQSVPSILQAEVLKAGHHGGMGTNTQALLDRVFSQEGGRRYAVISSGRRDNLPAPDTVERLNAMVGDFGLYRTDRGDEAKRQREAQGDDHILLRVSVNGDITMCYVYADE